jgi:hypothetical protein
VPRINRQNRTRLPRRQGGRIPDDAERLIGAVERHRGRRARGSAPPTPGADWTLYTSTCDAQRPSSLLTNTWRFELPLRRGAWSRQLS